MALDQIEMAQHIRHLITRIANIVLHPDREWQAIAQERRSAWQVFKRYLLPLI